MTDLYETLGVERDADAAAIRRAYRQRSKKAHPDAGGSAAEFDRLMRAKAVLLVPERRAAYDRDGTIDDAPDNAAAKAMSIVMQTVGGVIDMLLRQNVDPSRMDLVKLAGKDLRLNIDQAAKNARKARDDAFKLEAIAKRFGAKPRQVNRIGLSLAARIKEIEAVARQHDETRATLEAALVLVEQHVFDVDASPRHPLWPANTTWTMGV